MNKIIYENVKWLTKDTGLGEFEKKLGVSVGFFSRKANGDKNPIDYHLLMQVADIFNITLNDLFSEKTWKKIKIQSLREEAMKLSNEADSLEREI